MGKFYQATRIAVRISAFRGGKADIAERTLPVLEFGVGGQRLSPGGTADYVAATC